MPDTGEDFARKILRELERAESWLCIIGFILLVAIIFADVVSREVSGAGLYWATQSGVWANVLIVMAGFGLASSDGAHLRPRFADNWLPDAWAAPVETAQHALMSLFCIAAAWLAGMVVLGSWQLGVVSLDLFLPIWPVQLLLPAALAAAALRHAIYSRFKVLRPAETGAMVLSGQDMQT